MSLRWIGGADYDEDDPVKSRATEFIDGINWEAVVQHCTQLRRGVKRHLRTEFSLGHCNLVRHMVF